MRDALTAYGQMWGGRKEMDRSEEIELFFPGYRSQEHVGPIGLKTYTLHDAQGVQISKAHNSVNSAEWEVVERIRSAKRIVETGF